MIKAFLIVLLLQLTLQSREINLNTMLEKANQENKHLYLWLHKTGCGFCDTMEEFTLKNTEVNKFIKKYFLSVHINVSENDLITYDDFKGSGNQFAQELGYAFYPSSLFFDNESEIIFAEVGYINNKENPNEERILKILHFIQSKSYEDMEYYDYKYNKKKEF